MSTLTHYHKTIRKINAAFASLFNNIVLIRYNTDGSENQRLIVPIEFGDKEKYLKRLEGDPELHKKIQVLLPRMSYELTGFRYDASRKLNTNNLNFASSSSSDKVLSQYNPIPYDFSFALTIYTRTVEDGNQILEQIIPYFTPDYSLRLNLIPEMNITRTVPIVLNSVQQMIDADGPFNSEVRTVMWTLGFNVKAFIFGAIKDSPIITNNASGNGGVQINIRTNSGNNISDEMDFAGVCCEGNMSRSFIMSPTCNKDYAPNEVVYQGINFNNAYASARVYNWNNKSNTLILTQICGDFRLNQPIVGTDTLTMRIPQANAANSVIEMKITTVPQPNTATANSCWVANTTIKEFPNT